MRIIRCCSAPPWPRLVALKQAQYLRKTNPDGKAYIFYENMRTPGQYEKFLPEQCRTTRASSCPRGLPVGVSNGSSGLSVELKDTLLGEKLKIKVDLVVLSTGMVPVTKDSADPELEVSPGPFPARKTPTGSTILISSASRMRPSGQESTRQAA